MLGIDRRVLHPLRVGNGNTGFHDQIVGHAQQQQVVAVIAAHQYQAPARVDGQHLHQGQATALARHAHDMASAQALQPPGHQRDQAEDE